MVRAFATLLVFVATPAFAANHQCVGRAEGANGAQAHVVLVVDDAGERLDGLVAWSPPVKAGDGLPFAVDLLYGMGSLERGTFFDMSQIRITLAAPMDPPLSPSLRAAVSTSTSNSRIARPWPAYEEAVAAGRRSPMEGVLAFSMGDGSDAVFYGVEDKDPELWVEIAGADGKVHGRRTFDLTATAERDRLAAEAFRLAGEKATAPAEKCEAMR